MEVRTYTVYKFDELPEDSKKKAIEKWRQQEDFPFLEDELKEKLDELLKENGLAGEAEIYYSLASCQGDGVCFEGVFSWQGFTVTVKHVGRYTHENSKIFSIDPLLPYGENQADLNSSFDELYIEICNKLETYGYEHMSGELSEESIIETLVSNNYDFKLDGSID